MTAKATPRKRAPGRPTKAASNGAEFRPPEMIQVPGPPPAAAPAPTPTTTTGRLAALEEKTALLERIVKKLLVQLNVAQLAPQMQQQLQQRLEQEVDANLQNFG